MRWNTIKTRKDRDDYEHKTAEYWKEARKYVKTMSDDPKEPAWIAFRFENEEICWAWERYFDWRLGFMPRGMLYLKSGIINEFLVPAALPQDFDPSYKPKERSI